MRCNLRGSLADHPARGAEKPPSRTALTQAEAWAGGHKSDALYNWQCVQPFCADQHCHLERLRIYCLLQAKFDFACAGMHVPLRLQRAS